MAEADAAGRTAEAREYFHFVRDVLDNEQGLQVMYTVDGRRVPVLRLNHAFKGVALDAPGEQAEVERDNYAKHRYLRLEEVGFVVVHARRGKPGLGNAYVTTCAVCPGGGSVVSIDLW